MDTFEIPIFKKAFELYKISHLLRKSMPKQDRFTIWQRYENTILDIMDYILLAAQLPKVKKLPELEKINFRLNFLRVLLRLAKEINTIDNKKYTQMEAILNEIGRMLGGWLKSTKEEIRKITFKQNTPH